MPKVVTAVKDAIFGVIIRFLKNEHGLTAIEYGLIAALMLIALEHMATRL